MRIFRKDKDDEGLFHKRHMDLVWYGRRGDYEEDKNGLWIIPLYSKYYDSTLDVIKRIYLGEKVCTCDIGVKGDKYVSKMCSYHYNGKCLMCSHGSLLMFLVLSRK